MELALVIYLIDLLAGISVGLPITIAICIFLSLIGVAAVHDFATEDVWKATLKRLPKFYKICAVVLMSSVLLVWVTPSKETSYAMLAAYGVQTVAESEQVQEVAGKSLKVLEKYMDDYLEQTPEKSED